MRGFDMRILFRCLAVITVMCLLSQKVHGAEDYKVELQEKFTQKGTPFVMLLIVLPKACAQTYPDDNLIKKKADAIEYGFVGHLDDPDAKKRFGIGEMLPPDATEEMHRKLQERTDEAWEKMAKTNREFFAAERVACVVKNMKLDKNQCYEMINTWGVEEPPEPTEEQARKIFTALEATLDPCVSLVKDWPGKDYTPPN